MKLRSVFWYTRRWLVGAALAAGLPAALTPLPAIAGPNGGHFETIPSPYGHVNPVPAPPPGTMVHIGPTPGTVVPVPAQSGPIAAVPSIPANVGGLPPDPLGPIESVPGADELVMGLPEPHCGGKRAKCSVWNCFCQGPGCDKCAVVPRGAQPAPNGYYLHQWMGRQASKAEADDFVIYNNMWYMGGTTLGPLGKYQLDMIARRLNREPFPVVIATSKDPAVDQARREAVLATLAQVGFADPTRVIIAFPAAEGLYGEEAFRVYNALLSIGQYTRGGIGGFGGLGGFGSGFGYGGFGYLPYGGFGTFGRFGF